MGYVCVTELRKYNYFPLDFRHLFEFGFPRPKPTCIFGGPLAPPRPEGSVVRLHQPCCSYATSGLNGSRRCLSFSHIRNWWRCSLSRPPIIIWSSQKIISLLLRPPLGFGISYIVPLLLILFRLSCNTTLPSGSTVMGTLSTVGLPHF